MELNDQDMMLIEALCGGLSLVPDPYADLGARVGLSEDQVIAGIKRLVNGGIIKRFGVVVQHRKLGYTANAMSVWDIPDAEVSEIGNRMGRFPFVTLCYRRPRHLPDWPYNLFAMVHGDNRDKVRRQVDSIADVLGLAHVERDVLFSTHQFKQCGARYKCTKDHRNDPCRFD